MLTDLLVVYSVSFCTLVTDFCIVRHATHDSTVLGTCWISQAHVPGF
jgi:hypothetical protein